MSILIFRLAKQTPNLTTAIDAALDSIDVVEDMHASASYRRRVAAELARRAVDDALSEIAQDLS